MRIGKKAALFGATLFSGLVLTSCSSKDVNGLGFEHNLSSVNDTSLSLWQGAWITAAIVGVFTAILILWPAFRHRRKGNEFPRQTQYHVPTEIAYTLIPFIIVAVLFYFTAKDESAITKIDKNKPAAHKIHVNGIQWSWQFSYPEAGPKAVVTGTPSNPPVLYVPQGEKVRFTLTSNDVVHGFWIPAFMIQMQNIPGVKNQLEFTAEKLGEYRGFCNILCGRQHSQMRFTVKVVTPAEYDAYIQSLKAGVTG